MKLVKLDLTAPVLGDADRDLLLVPRRADASLEEHKALRCVIGIDILGKRYSISLDEREFQIHD